jgi:hypothetical protein
MKKLARFIVLFVAVVLMLLLATACSPGEADYYDAVYEVTYPDGTEGVIEADNTPQLTQCRYFDEGLRDYLGKYVEENAGVEDADLEQWCLDHYEDRFYPNV